ncbi:MAG: S24 family peptidase [Candidatus Pacebacteria bacterium]|nr:S24 family peptidase [Candidatus Paceibacterota bacterium]
MNENQQKLIDLAKKKDISKMTFREIGRELGIPNPQTVIYHLDQLKKKGLLYLDIKKRQRVAKPKAFAVDKLFSIPLVGSANCGPAMELAQEDIQKYLKITQTSLKRSKPDGLIAVRAVGDSLNKANIGGENIEDGDYVIVDCKQQPSNGDYVLSIIDGAANFKKFFKDDSKHEIRLVSESTQEIPPIILHESDINSSSYMVNGVAVRVIKK